MTKRPSKRSPLVSNKKTTTCESIKTLAYFEPPLVYSGHPAGMYSSISVASLNNFVQGAILSEGEEHHVTFMSTIIKKNNCSKNIKL